MLGKPLHSALLALLIAWGGMVAPVLHWVDHAAEHREVLHVQASQTDHVHNDYTTLTHALAHPFVHQDWVCVCLQHVTVPTLRKQHARVLVPERDQRFHGGFDRAVTHFTAGNDRSRAPPVLFA